MTLFRSWYRVSRPRSPETTEKPTCARSHASGRIWFDEGIDPGDEILALCGVTTVNIGGCRRQMITPLFIERYAGYRPHEEVDFH